MKKIVLLLIASALFATTAFAEIKTVTLSVSGMT